MSDFIIKNGILQKYIGDDQEISVPEGVTNIGASAFRNCASLKSVTIPEGVADIGAGAFYNCNSLEKVYIPNSVKNIGNRAFYNCNSLKYVMLPNSVTSIGMGAFSRCDSLTDIILPDGITTVEADTFYLCYSLSSITIPKSVTSIYGSAFFQCTSLNAVHITDIAAWCNIEFFPSFGSPLNPLHYAHNLYLNGELVTDLIIPEGVTKIKKYTFNDCHSINRVTIPHSITDIDIKAFSGCDSLECAIDPDGNLSEKWNGICICSSLGLIVEDGVLKKYNGSKGNLDIPNIVTSIEEYAFEECTSLTSVIIPDSVTDIGEYCFASCKNLKSIRFPKKLSIIPEGICSYCNALNKIVFPENLTRIKRKAFYKSSIPLLSLPAGVIIESEVFEELRLYGCERPPIRFVRNVHYTINDNDPTIYFKTYSDADEEKFRKQADEWRYDTSFTETHETWYEDTTSESPYLKELESEAFIIKNNELVGVCLIGGTVTSSVWGTDRNISLQSLYFDGHNGVKEIKYSYSSGNDEFSRGESSVWKLSRKISE